MIRRHISAQDDSIGASIYRLTTASSLFINLVDVQTVLKLIHTKFDVSLSILRFTRQTWCGFIRTSLHVRISLPFLTQIHFVFCENGTNHRPSRYVLRF